MTDDDLRTVVSVRVNGPALELRIIPPAKGPIVDDICLTLCQADMVGIGSCVLDEWVRLAHAILAFDIERRIGGD